MTFLQPLLLAGLPLVALPIIIHLLNRQRHRTIDWGAMMFLLKATRESKGHKKLRHILILACRVLALAALLFALSRPLAGGWLGRAGGSAPDTVILLLDRSVSMELLDPQSKISKRENALAKLTNAISEYGHSSRIVLIDSAKRVPQEVAKADLLKEFSTTKPTNTKADIPAMIEIAVDYIGKNLPGKTEIWLASDLQESDWLPNSGRWGAIQKKFAELKQEVRVRILGMTQKSEENVAVSIKELRRDGNDIVFTVLLEKMTDAPLTVPVSYIIEGARSQEEVQMTAPSMSLQKRLSLGERKEATWGWIEVPADSNLRDNAAFFTLGEKQLTEAYIVADIGYIANILKFSSAPAPRLLNQKATLIGPTQLRKVKWDQTSMVVWQTALPTDKTSQNLLEDFVKQGGTLIFFPPGAEDEGTIFETSWGAIKEAPEKNYFEIREWRDDEGPLARGRDGRQLAVDFLEVKKYQEIEGQLDNLATYKDSEDLFLGRKKLGKGWVFFCSTLPTSDEKAVTWSNLADGLVLVPMIQRILQFGASRLGSVQSLVCGERTAINPGAIWNRLDKHNQSNDGNKLYEAGVYEVEKQFVALNRPRSEDDWRFLEDPDLKMCLGEVPYVLFEQRESDDNTIASEVWRVFLIGMLLFLLGEALFSLPPAQKKEIRI